MASSGTGCDPVVIESDENNSSQNELDSENNFKCCHGKKTYKAEDVLKLTKLNLTLELTLPLFIVNRR